MKTNPNSDKGCLFVVSGPSGVGKGTVLSRVLNDDGNLYCSVSATTREPREGEVDGVHYHFYQKDEFEKQIKNGEMLEYATYNGNYYGTPAQMVDRMRQDGKDVVLEIETKGAQNVKRRMPDAVLIMILPPAFSELEARLKGRGTEDEKTIKSRLAIAMKEIQASTAYDYVVVNDEISNAVAQLESIVFSERIKKNKNRIIKEVLQDVVSVSN